MNGKQSAVLWLGLTLIVVRLFTTSQWKQIWTNTILKGEKSSSNLPGGLSGELQDPFGMHPLFSGTSTAKTTGNGTISV